jgi:hypothetical protein
MTALHSPSTSTVAFQTLSKTPIMEFRQYPNGVYEFYFFESSKRAVDAWLAEIEKFYKLPPETKVRILVNTTYCHDQPLAYAFRRAGELIPKYPNRPRPMYYVFLGSKKVTFMRQFLMEFVRRLNTGDKTIYLYGEEEFQRAMNWLSEA